MAQLASSVDDELSVDRWRQIDIGQPAQVHFDYDERGIMSLNLELSGQRTRDIVHDLHHLKGQPRFLSLGEAFAEIQMFGSVTPLKPDKEQYRTSLVWQVNQELEFLANSYHRTWSCEQMTEFCHLMLGVLIDVHCIQNTYHGHLSGVSTSDGRIWTDFVTDEKLEIREMFLVNEKVNLQGLYFVSREIESRLCSTGMEGEALSHVLFVCGQLALTNNRVAEKFKLRGVLVRDHDEEEPEYRWDNGALQTR